MVQKSLRRVPYKNGEIVYLLEQKSVQNLNLRIHRDGKVFVSANFSVPVTEIDTFVIKKGAYIQNAQKQFEKLAYYASPPKQYISGETFRILGRSLRLKVSQAPKNKITTDGVFLLLELKKPADKRTREQMVTSYLNHYCSTLFQEISEELYPIFRKYGIDMPTIRIRTMDTQWGSCLPQKQTITLNKRLLEMPRNCIEYVIMHEFCHFIHPNHSKLFYEFLTMLMPDWKIRKEILDKNATFDL